MGKKCWQGPEAPEKKCSICGKVKSISEYRIRKKSGRTRSDCKDCMAVRDKIRYAREQDKILAKKKIYAQNLPQERKDARKEYEKNWHEVNKEREQKKRMQHYDENKEELNRKNNEWRKKKQLGDPEGFRAAASKTSKASHARKKHDPIYRTRRGVSTAIWQILNYRGAKKTASILEAFGYDYIDLLVAHIASQFTGENSWMTWENRGNYDLSTWDDTDKSTWTWNLDHIIPHSTFDYTAITDEACVAAWELSNLRPYPSKHNVSEGDRGHRKTKTRTP